MWWENAVVYQVYPRSFQDSDGDGLGDLAGIASRLDHLLRLGVDALWMSPINPSPMADFGYDVSDYEDVDPAYGTLDDLDALVSAVHERGMRLLMDLVPCHTSIEHPWFAQHPDWYVWTDRPNNWRAAFGGSAWERLGDRYYLHSFYPEQPDLNWRNPEVVEAMQGVVRFWLERGADGYRLDALDRLLKDPQMRDDPPAAKPFGLPVPDFLAGIEPVHSRNAPDIGTALAAMREAAGRALLVGEVYLPAARWGPYLEHLDRTFAFELLHSPWEAGALRAAIAASTARPGGAAWAMSNHDFGRLATRYGPEHARSAAMMLLTLPGPAFIYQGDEIGQQEGPDGTRWDRHGRDRHRHPMQWDASPSGGFTTGRPWLPAVDPERTNVEAQRDDPASMLNLVRELIAVRRTLGESFDLLDSAPGVVAYRRGDHTVAVNTTAEPRPAPAGLGERVLSTVPGARSGGELRPHAGEISLGC